MAERRQRQPADGALADLRKNGGPQLVETLRHHPSEPVGDNQRHGRRDHDVARRKGVYRVLVEDRHVDCEELGGEQQHDRDHHPRPQLA